MIAAYPDFSVQEREDNSMRPDGTRVKGLSAVVQALPYVMPKRYDAQNMTTETADEDIIRKYIREKRREGRAVTHMSLLIAAYYRAYLQHPKINYFIMNSKVYERNHFCVSFVMLKTRADGTPDETVLKIFLEPADDVFSITEKIRAAIDCNARREHDNATDRFVTVAFSVPGLAWLIFRGAYLMDRLGILPRKIIDLSPFHTSLFITNLASIKTRSIYHHCYEFGTTSVFVCMGKPEVAFGREPGKRKKALPLGIVMDERICTGVEYARFAVTLRQYLQHPQRLEGPGETVSTDAGTEEEAQD